MSDIPVDDIHIVRFDQALFETGGESPELHLQKIASRYPDIFKAYAENYWGLFATDSTQSINVFDSLNILVVSNEWMKRLYDSVQHVYPNMDDVEADLKQAVKYYRYYFPDSILPQFYTYVGPFAYWAMIDDKTLGIELDMFMGEHFGYYGNFENNLPQYITVRCNREYIVANAMETLINGVVPGKGADATLLDEMITRGKILYYLDLMLPDTPDSIKIGYTKKQVEWCYDNEDEIWKYMVGEDLLFSKKTDHFKKYLEEAPTSVGMPDEAPGRVAVWVGWQIVRAYMKEHSEKTLQQLFYEMDGLQLLKESGYDPGG
ncbi:MAG TPA: hypothetical protein VG961_11030 [Ignavibacteria bacterium]|nr:hypothetical protein [Ignavibacteria bacterium]